MGHQIPTAVKLGTNASLAKQRTLSLALLLFTAASCASFTGCSAMHGAKESWLYNGGWNDAIMGYRNQAWANKSWHARKHQFCRERHFHEFAEGFRAGYMAVADGSDGCTPAFAPRQYWSWRYQSAEGQEKVSSWYAGYPHGARAAEEDGIGNWTQIQTSSGIQQRYADQGLLGPGQSPGMYPMPQAEPLAAAYAKELTARGGQSLVVGDGNENGSAPSNPIGSAVKPNSPLIQR
jgi:hypothetical protein